MSDVPEMWILLVFAFPVLHTYYYGAFLGSFIDLEETDLTYWTYSVFAFGGGALFFFFAPIEIPFGFELWFLLLFPLGIGLYFLETWLWYQYTKKPIEVASEPVEGMIPVPFVSIPEEIVFRGGLLPLVAAVGAPAYIVLSGLLFGLYHYVFSFRDVFLKWADGMIYAGLFLATGSLWASIVMHMGYNLASMYIIADYRHIPYLRQIAPGPDPE